MDKQYQQPRDETNGQFLAPSKCLHGHEYTPENTRLKKNRGRFNRECRECNRLRMLARADDPRVKAWKKRYDDARTLERDRVRREQKLAY